MRLSTRQFSFQLALVLALAAGLGACIPNILFDREQPHSEANLGAVPAAMRGVYSTMVSEDKYTLNLKADRVTASYYITEKYNRNEKYYKNNFYKKGSQAYKKNIDGGQPIPVRLTNKGDSVLVRVLSVRTAYRAGSPDYALKQYKGSYYFNKRGRSGWQVLKVEQPSNNILRVDYSTREDLEKLRAATAGTIQERSDNDSLGAYTFAPMSDAEFKQYIAAGGFSGKLDFKRQK
jgi:hypothetical protein